jgi:peptide/nickel transport system ATP-binding protein
LRAVRGREIAMIFQDPMSSLNPVLTISDQISETLRLHQGLDAAASRQRAMIALALACDPRILVADEPTTALDVTIQAQILGLISDLQKRLGTAQILITHDLGVVSEVADRVIVMYAGRKVEEASIYDLFDRPFHPYTIGLMGAVPRAGASSEAGDRLADISGTVPPLWDLPKGCAFAPRCPNASARCLSERPPFEEKRPGHWAACWEHDDAA